MPSNLAAPPRLKPLPVARLGDQLVVSRRALERMHLNDPDGGLTALLQAMRPGTLNMVGLADELTRQGHTYTPEQVAQAVDQLDDLGLLEQADADQTIDPASRERHRSNLRFYDLFTDLGRSSADFHRTARRSHVLLLGVGGLGSGVLQSLLGLGIGRVTLIDVDVVEVGNLARQFLYGPSSLGRKKVDAARDWAQAYSPETDVVTLDHRISDAQCIVEAAGDADLVVCAIDTPDDVHLIVNQACFALDVPYIAGGLFHSTLAYWSVQPGTTPCRRCLDLHQRDEERARSTTSEVRISEAAQVNRATGPVVQLAAGLLGLEAMRYILQTEPPVAAATYQVVELADGMHTSRSPWTRHDSCELCPPRHDGEATLSSVRIVRQP
jgi:molybdopterin/thiamine biosynthesis adenylyltransferase